MPKYSDLKISWEIGKSSGKSTGPGKLPKAFEEALKNRILHHAEEKVNVSVFRMVNWIERLVPTEYARGIEHAVRNLMGTESRGGQGKGGQFTTEATTFSVFQNDEQTAIGVKPPRQLGKVDATFRYRTKVPSAFQWRPLSAEWMKEKGNRKYFVNTGDLRGSIRRIATGYVKDPGKAVKVFVTRKDKNGRLRDASGRFTKVHTHDMKIRLLPNINPTYLPALMGSKNGKWDPNVGFEKALGFRGLDLEKLRGPRLDFGSEDRNVHVHRPLLQPVFTYWTLFQIPNAIARGITNARLG